MPKRPPSTTEDPEKAAASALAQASGRYLSMLLPVVGWSQSQLSRLLNVDQSTVNKWLKGTRLAPPYHMLTIAQQAGCTLDFLYTGNLTSVTRDDLRLALAASHPGLVLGSRPEGAARPAPVLPAKVEGPAAAGTSRQKARTA